MSRRLPNRFRQVSVRFQILLGFGLILILVAIVAVIGYGNLRALQNEAEAALQKAGRVRELSLLVENEFLAARQAETAFSDEWRVIGTDAAISTHGAANADHLAQARASLVELDGLEVGAEDGTLKPLMKQTDELRPLLDTYEATFQEMVELTIERSRSGGTEAMLKDDLAELEQAVVPLPDPEPYRLLLQIDANAISYFATAQQQYADNIHLLANRFAGYVDESSPEQLVAGESVLEAEQLISGIQRYQATFQELADLESSIAESNSTFQDVTSDINDMTEQISVEGGAIIVAARERLETISRRMVIELILATAIALNVGVLAAYLLGQQIATPLRQLSQAAQQIGRGNLDHQVQVKGGHEIVTLASSFNSMAAQLRQLLGRLEQLVANRTRALQASAEISRSLSTILDRERLISAVVEQIKGTFDYYHAHIYLFDDERAYLVMVGGTGEAGLAMLGRGHKIARGKGLVGRAADTNSVVLVSDVSQEADWLPNPLLPETRSEIAVPIAIGEQVLGVLDVQNDTARGLTDEDARLLQSVASQVAIALRNAGLYQQAQQQAEREALINAINQKIRSANDLEAVMQVTAQELGKALNTRRANVQVGALSNRQNGS